MRISKTAEKYVLNTQYAFNNEGRLFLFHSTDHFQNDTKMIGAVERKRSGLQD